MLYIFVVQQDCTTTGLMWWELRHPIEELLVCGSMWEELCLFNKEELERWSYMVESEQQL